MRLDLGAADRSGSHSQRAHASSITSRVGTKRMRLFCLAGQTCHGPVIGTKTLFFIHVIPSHRRCKPRSPPPLSIRSELCQAPVSLLHVSRRRSRHCDASRCTTWQVPAPSKYSVIFFFIIIRTTM